MINIKFNQYEDNVIRAIVENKIENIKVEPCSAENNLSENDNYSQRGFNNYEARKNRLSYSEMLWKNSPYRRRAGMSKGCKS